MPNFSTISMSRLNTCHPDLQRLMKEVIKETDITIICGHRNELDQNLAYEQGHSRLRFPGSKHNSLPSMAVDVAPWPINWKDINGFIALSKVIKAKAKELGIEVEYGGDWTTFKDFPHWQLPSQN